MQQPVSVFSLAESSMWAKGEREASLLLRLLITTSESPSRIKDEKPSSSAKEMARAATKASTMFEECGRGTYSDRDAMTCLDEFRITMPRPAFPISLNVVPSKFTFREVIGGGLHLTRGRSSAGT